MRVTRRDILPNQAKATFTVVMAAHAAWASGWPVSSTLAR
jgi:hypothetical protein